MIGEGRTTVSFLAAETTFELTRGGESDSGGPERVEVVAAITGSLADELTGVNEEPA